MKRPFILLILITVMTALIVGSCTQSAPTTTQGTQTTAVTSTTGSQTTANPSDLPAYLNLDSEFPIVKDGESVTITVTTVYNSSLGGKTEDLWFWKWCEKNMNIRFDVEQVMDSAAAERKSLLFASGNLRDLLLHMNLTTSDLVTYGQMEQKLMNLNDLMRPELAPNLLRVFDTFSELKASMSCPDGGMYTFPKIGLVNDPGGVMRLFINERWLEDLDLNMPKDLDSFYAVLQHFKEADPSATGRMIPLGGNNANYNPSVYVLSALGFVTRGMLEQPALLNGQVAIPGGHERYTDYVTYMNKLYMEGLMDSNFYTLDKTQADAQMAEKRVGVMQCPAPYLLLPQVEDFQAYAAMPPAVSAYNNTPIWSAPNSFIVGTIAMSSNASHPEATTRFVDWLFSQKGGVISWDGPQQGSEDTLGLVEGWYFDENETMLTADVVNGKYDSVFAYIQAAIAPGVTTLGNRSDILNDKRVVGGLAPLSDTVYDITNGDHYYRKTVQENIMPHAVSPFPNNLYFSEEDSIRLTDLGIVIKDFMDRETAKFITGARSLTEIDKYFSDLNALGFAEYLEYYETAYNAYLENLAR